MPYFSWEYAKGYWLIKEHKKQRKKARSTKITGPYRAF